MHNKLPLFAKVNDIETCDLMHCYVDIDGVPMCKCPLGSGLSDERVFQVVVPSQNVVDNCP